MSDADVLEKSPRARKKNRSTPVPELASQAVPAPGTKYLLVASGKGGSGKTTTTQMLAFLAAADGLHVAMVDLDKQRTLAKWCTRRPSDMLQVDCYESTLAEIVHEIAGLTVYDLVILDTPPGLDDYPAQTKALIGKMDFVLAPTGVRTVEMESVIEVMTVVHYVGKPGAYLLTRTNRRTSAYIGARRVLSGAPGQVCPVDIPQYEDIGIAQDGGYVVTEMKGGKGGEDIIAVWNFVKKELGL
jgi:chromosome partitioning protein